MAGIRSSWRWCWEMYPSSSLTILQRCWYLAGSLSDQVTYFNIAVSYLPLAEVGALAAYLRLYVHFWTSVVGFHFGNWLDHLAPSASAAEAFGHWFSNIVRVAHSSNFAAKSKHIQQSFTISFPLSIYFFYSILPFPGGWRRMSWPLSDACPQSSHIFILRSNQ